MSKTITYIYRKQRPKFFSVENVFDAIAEEVSKTRMTEKIFLKMSGGGLRSILVNCINIANKKNQISHITGDVHYMAMASGQNSILTIHDVNSIIKGNYFKKLYLKLFWFWLPALLVKRITVISNFTKNELVQVIPFAKKKIRVIHNPVDSIFSYHPKEINTEVPKILLIGTKSNKNLERVLKALEGLRCHIMILGVLNKEHKHLLELYGIDYTNKHNLPFAKVVDTYKEADIVCFVSTYEGFGMPIIEAQATGRPVITSNIGAMREIAADSACLVDPFSVESIKNGLVKVISNTGYRQELIEKGLSNIERFKLKNIASQYIQLYNDM